MTGHVILEGSVACSTPDHGLRPLGTRLRKQRRVEILANYLQGCILTTGREEAEERKMR